MEIVKVLHTDGVTKFSQEILAGLSESTSECIATENTAEQQACWRKLLLATQLSTIDAALEMTYWWHIKNPLFRGSAALGYAAMVASALAAGMEVVPQSKETWHSDVQMDLEAVFAASAYEFKNSVRMLFAERKPVGERLARLLETENSENLIVSKYPTFRDIIQVLNRSDEQGVTKN